MSLFFLCRYKVYHIHPITVAESEILNKYQDNGNFDFWSRPRILGAPVALMVTPEAQPSFEEEMRSSGLNYTLLIANVEE